MGRAASPSVGRRYGLARVCRALEIPRSTVYAERAPRLVPGAPRKRGPKTAWTDAELTERIRGVLAASPFVGEGYHKAWARLRLAGVRTSKARVLRLMRAAGLLAPTRTGRPPDGPRTTARSSRIDRMRCGASTPPPAGLSRARPPCSSPSSLEP